jgi:hypothetical protein
MTGPFRADIELLLTVALTQEAEAAMATTDTHRELERFQADNAKRRTRVRIFAAAAAVAVVIGGVWVGTTIGHGSGRRGEQPAHIVPRPSVITHATLPAVPTQLRPSDFVSSPHAGFDPILALGSVWTTNGHVLFRIAPDGQRVESKISYKPATSLSLSEDPVPPFAVGSSLLVPAVDNGHEAYLFLDAHGRRLGTLPVSGAGPGHADSTGAWVVTGTTKLSRLSADGRHITHTLTFPGTQLAGVDEGGGYIWLLDNFSSAVLKVDPATGKVVGRSPTSLDPVNAMLYAADAVYLATQAYDVRRIDPKTMKFTAIEAVNRDNQWGWQFLVAGPDGSLWTDAGDTAIAQLDPETLHPLSFTAINTDNLGYHNGGTGIFAVSADKVYVAGTSHDVLYTVAR